MTDPQPVGVDLARVALQAARAASKHQPAQPAARPVRRRTARPGDGRDPMRLGAAIGNLITEHGWEAPAAGGTVIDQWPQIAPELVGHVTAEGYDPATGTLTLRPATAAHGAQLRLLHASMVERINAKMGRTVVRALRVLPPGGRPATDSPTRATPTTPSGPTATPGLPGGPAIRSRADASPGLLAAQATVAAARDRLPATTTPAAAVHPPTLREPEGAFTDAEVMREDLEAAAAAAEDVHARALAVARATKAGRAPAVPRAFDRTA